MKKIIRFITLVLIISTLSGMLAACAQTESGGGTKQNADTTAEAGISENAATTIEETIYVQDDLEEKYEFNETVTIYIWSDHRMREYFAEDNGNNIDSAIFQRNLKVEERLGIKLEFVGEKGSLDYYKDWNQKAENDWMSDNAYDVYSGYSRAIPLLAIKGMTVNLLEYEDFNSQKPWWPEALTSECTLQNKLLFCTGDIATSVLWYMDAVMYNKELYERYYLGEPTPMDMVDSNEWTCEKLFSITKDVYTPGDDGLAINGKYGMSVYETDIDAFQIGAGIISLEQDADGGLKISEKWNSQYCADVCEAVGEFLRSDGVFHEDADEVRDVFFNERSIFHLDRVLIVAGQDNTDTGKIDFSYGIVPVPKYDPAQEDYKTNLGNSFSLYAVNSNSAKASIAVTVLEAMGSQNYRSVTPAVFEVAMKLRYSDDPQSSRMYDILRSTVSFDIGRLYSAYFSNYTSKTFRVCALDNPTGFLTMLKTRSVGINRTIDKLMSELNG